MKKFLTLITAFSLCIGLLFFSNTKKTAVKAANSVDTEVLFTNSDRTEKSFEVTTRRGANNAISKVFIDASGELDYDDSKNFVLTLPVVYTVEIPTITLTVVYDGKDGVSKTATFTVADASNEYAIVSSVTKASGTNSYQITFHIGKKITADDGWDSDVNGKYAVVTQATISIAKAKTGTNTVTFFRHVHSLTKTEAVTATCTKDGNLAYWYCSTCNKYFMDNNGVANTEQEIPAYMLSTLTISSKGHSQVAVPKEEATCTKDGHESYYYCNNCKTYYSDVACEHAIGTTQAEAEEAVKITASHDLQTVAEVASTCKTHGVAKHEECSVCHKLFVNGVEKTEAELELPLASHNYELFLSQVAATYNTIGTKAVYRCTVCNELFIKDANGEYIVRTTDNMNIGKNITSMQVILGSAMTIRFTSPLNGKMYVYYKVNGVEKRVILSGKSDGKGNYTYDFDKLVPYEILQTLRVNLEEVTNNTNGEYDLNGELITSSVYDYLLDSCKVASGDKQAAIVAFVKYAEAMRAYFKPEYIEINTTAFAQLLGEENNYVERDATWIKTNVKDDKGVPEGTTQESSLFSGVYVMYNNSVQLCFALKGKYSVQVTCAGNIVDYSIDDDNVVTGKADINPANFGSVYRVTLGSSDYYEISVNGYFSRLLQSGKPTEAEVALIVAAYNYGANFKAALGK